MLDPGGELGFVERVVFVDVEVADFQVFGRAGGTGGWWRSFVTATLVVVFLLAAARLGRRRVAPVLVWSG